jgi:hypothetical protein
VLIRTRFDHVSAPGADGTTLVVDDLDQAAVRALLTLLWDAGHEVLSLTADGRGPSGVSRRPGSPRSGPVERP